MVQQLRLALLRKQLAVLAVQEERVKKAALAAQGGLLIRPALGRLKRQAALAALVGVAVIPGEAVARGGQRL